MKRYGLLALALAVMAAAPAAVSRYTADVTAVSILPSPGRAEVVVDLRGVVEVSDFVLRQPDRLVLDLVGARLVAPVMQYDGVNRAGIRNIRYAQFRSDVVRVVVELDEARDYEVRQETNAVRVALSAVESFEAWSSDRQRTAAAAAPAPAAAPAAPAPTTPAPRVLPAAIPAAQQQPASTQAPVSFVFDNASIQEVISAYAGFSGRSIILGRDITGAVTAEIRNQPWDLSFNAILAGQGLAASELPGGIIRVDSRANLQAQDSTEPLRTRVLRINYARATALAGSVSSVVTPGRGRAVADTITNSIIVTDLQSRMDQIESFIQSLDVRTPQVAIQARIIFVDRTDLEELGIRYDLGSNGAFFNTLLARPDLAADPTGATPFDPATTPYAIALGGNSVAAVANASERLRNGNPALQLIYSTVIGNFSLTSFLDALQQVTLADVQAEPSITVADNRPAELFSGEATPIRVVDAGAAAGAATAARATTTFRETGIRLSVTPHVVQSTREILLEAVAERSQLTPSALSEIGAVFSEQRATTQLLVRDGETAVIGGLTVTEVTVTKSGIPFLVDLPVIGPLFGFRSSREVRRDLLILVTPHIVDDLQTVRVGGQVR
jgi:type IV pilus assembly protein PilQ